MFIVSDGILERLICSQCGKYLSVKTIKVYPNRGIKCGRCSNVVDAGVVSLFGVLAEQALFRCVNRFEGCNQLLTYFDVAKHEISCVGQEFECPCCIKSFKGTGYEIYVHFKEHHTHQLLVNSSEIVLEIDNELTKNFLYRKNDLLFFINTSYNKGEEQFILSATYFGSDQDALKVSQMFSLHSLNAKLIYKTKRKRCCSVNGENFKYFKINISPGDFSKNVVLCRFDLSTENVENLVVLPENYRKREHPEDKKASSIIKPSIFGTATYPVSVFNPTPTSDKSILGFNASTSVSTTGTTNFSFGKFVTNSKSISLIENQSLNPLAASFKAPTTTTPVSMAETNNFLFDATFRPTKSSSSIGNNSLNPRTPSFKAATTTPVSTTGAISFSFDTSGLTTESCSSIGSTSLNPRAASFKVPTTYVCTPGTTSFSFDCTPTGSNTSIGNNSLNPHVARSKPLCISTKRSIVNTNLKELKKFPNVNINTKRTRYRRSASNNIETKEEASSSSFSSERNKFNMMPCPICSVYFPREDIEEHADRCGEDTFEQPPSPKLFWIT